MTDGVSVLDHDTAAQWDQYLASRDQALRNALTERYLPLARSIAASVFKSRLDDSVAFDDFLQYARMGLMQAVERFDPKRGIVFEAFAARRVRGAILNSYAERRRERLRSIKEHSGGDRLQYLVRVTVTAAIAAMLDEEFEEPADEAVASNPYASAELSQLGQALWGYMASLPERQRFIVQQHYVGGLEFQDIAQQLQLSKGRVSQLHAQALEQLRAALKATLHPVDRRF